MRFSKKLSFFEFPKLLIFDVLETCRTVQQFKIAKVQKSNNTVLEIVTHLMFAQFGVLNFEFLNFEFLNVWMFDFLNF